MNSDKPHGNGVSTCAKCGRALGAAANRCMYCGARKGRQCPKCKSVVPAGALICCLCNSPIPASTPNYVLERPASPNTAAEPMPAALPIPSRSRKWAWAGAVIAFLAIVVALLVFTLPAKEPTEQRVPFRPRQNVSQHKPPEKRPRVGTPLTTPTHKEGKTAPPSTWPVKVPDKKPHHTPGVPSWAKVSNWQVQKAREAGIPVAQEVDLGNGVSMKMVYIPTGSFMMGSPANEKGRDAYECPQHKVKIAKPFYMGVYEVTQEQYQQIMGKNPSHFRGAKNPVEKVSWHDAVEFCRRLSQRQTVTYRLPTEAEWEYACRAGSRERYWWGHSQAVAQRYANLIDQTAEKKFPEWTKRPNWIRSEANDGYALTAPVGHYAANAFGLYDSSGNVWEWCQSLYKAYPYRQDDGREDPQARDKRVRRGGGWASGHGNSRSAARLGHDTRKTGGDIGFRVVCSARVHAYAPGLADPSFAFGPQWQVSCTPKIQGVLMGMIPYLNLSGEVVADGYRCRSCPCDSTCP